MSVFYGLNDDVYLVDGDFNSAIYDLKEGRLYRVDNKKFYR